MGIRLCKELRTARLQDIINKMGAGSKALLYSGTITTNFGDPLTTQKLLAQLNLDTPCGTIVDLNPTSPHGIVELHLSVISNDNAHDDGDFGFVELVDAAGKVIVDGDCGAVGSGAFVEMNPITTVKGSLVLINSMKLVENNV